MNIWLESFVCFMVFPVNSNFVGIFFCSYSESLSNPNFHWVLNRAQHHMDMLTTDKKNLVLWGKRLHIAIQVSLIFFYCFAWKMWARHTDLWSLAGLPLAFCSSHVVLFVFIHRYRSHTRTHHTLFFFCLLLTHSLLYFSSTSALFPLFLLA